MLFCYSVLAPPPPRAPFEPEVCVFPLRAVVFLALLVLTSFFFFLFSSLPSLFRFRFGHRMFHPVFSLRVPGTMLAPRFRFLLRLVQHMICILIRTYTDLTCLFLSETGDNRNAGFHKKLEFQRYPPKDFCTARYELKSSKKSFKLFKNPENNNSWADLGPRSA